MAARTFVSGVGDDVNPGSRTAPCKTFPGAFSKTDAGGEIDALDPGGFGTITIIRSLMIDGTAGAGFASILAPGTNAITVNAATSDIVVLRNLSLNCVNTGLIGIRILSAGAVIIENCSISGFRSASAGIGIQDTRASGGSLGIVNCDVRNNNAGIVVRTSGTAALTSVIDNCHVYFNFGNGISIANGARSSIKRSVLSNNVSSGLLAEQAIGVTDVNVDDCVISANGTGITVTSGLPTVRLHHSTVDHNGVGIQLTSGVVRTFGNNRIVANLSGNAATAGNLPLG